jgi:hypothetical protein
MHWIKRPLGLYTLLLLLAFQSASAWIEAGSYEGSGYSPFPGLENYSRTQFILTQEHLGNATGNLVGLEFLFTSSSATVYDSIQIKIDFLPVDSTVFNTNSFYDTSGLPVWHASAGWSHSAVEPEWVHFGNTGPAYWLDLDENLLVEVLTYSSNPQGDHETSRFVSSQSTLFAEGNGAWTAPTGNTNGVAPHVRTYGLATPVSGIWYSSQQITVDRDLIVLAGDQLEIRPNVDVLFDGYHVLRVRGQLDALGRADAPILFSPNNSNEGWNGLRIYGPDALATLEYCQIEGIRVDEARSILYYGAIESRYSAGLTLRDCEITDCFGRRYAFYSGYGPLQMQRCTLTDNGANDYFYFLLGVYNSSGDDALLQNVRVTQSNPLLYRCFVLEGANVRVENSHFPIFGYSSTVYNGPTFQNCTFTRPSQNWSYIGLSGSSSFSNCLFDGSSNAPYGPYPSMLAVEGGATATLSHCMTWAEAPILYEDGSLIELGGNVYADPLLADAQTGELSPNSPAIDAGDPFEADDPDLTRCDIGAVYYDQSRPQLTVLQDVPADQGRQLQLGWQAGSMDVAALGEFGSYSVWRRDNLNARSLGDARVIRQLEEIPVDEPGENLYWQRDDGTIWSFVALVPAMRLPQYGFVSPTLMDSSATGANPTTFKIGWHSSIHVSESYSASASSIDNIPPDAVQGLHAGAAVEGTVPLSWNPVTTGTLDGNSYPELGEMAYKVYYGDTPDFPCDAAHLVGTSAQPAALMSIPEGAARGFWKVRADDTP